MRVGAADDEGHCVDEISSIDLVACSCGATIACEDWIRRRSMRCGMPDGASRA